MTTSSRNVIWCAQSTVHSFGIPCQIPMSRASHVLRNAGLVLGLFGDQEPGYPADMLALTASWQSFTQCHPLDSGIAPPCFLFLKFGWHDFIRLFHLGHLCGCMRQFLCLQQVRKDSNMDCPCHSARYNSV